jgi:hypothetical protein
MRSHSDQRVVKRVDSTAQQVAKWEDSTVQQGQCGTDSINMAPRESSPYLPRQTIPQIQYENNDFQSNMLVFYKQELAIGWHKIPKDGRQALESLARYQKKLAQPELANLSLSPFEEPGPVE